MDDRPARTFIGGMHTVGVGGFRYRTSWPFGVLHVTPSEVTIGPLGLRARFAAPLRRDGGGAYVSSLPAARCGRWANRLR